jgi:4-diphosphocytidyl-2-C-methyl-D-erythritol kinase
VIIHAPAKVNLGLRLLRQREDGYHEIETFFHTLAWGDELSIEPSGSLSLTVVPARDAAFPRLLEGVPGDRSNLVWRAADLMMKRFDLPGAAITLTKRIPPGAGLGGGSSDAAATLRGMTELFRLDIPGSDLAVTAVELGADVPFLLAGGCALAEGIGEKLTPIEPLPGVPVVVVLHPCSIPTPWAYRAVGLKGEREARYRRYLDDVGSIAALLNCIDLRNDFEDPVIEACPDITDSLKALRDSGAFFVSLTGSGSAVYGLYTSERGAADAARRLGDNGLSVIETVLR